MSLIDDERSGMQLNRLDELVCRDRDVRRDCPHTRVVLDRCVGCDATVVDLGVPR